jgi:hypothetical protein
MPDPGLMKFVMTLTGLPHKLFGKRKRVDQFITVGVIVWRDNERKTAVKENDDSRWSSDDVVLWLERR